MRSRTLSMAMAVVFTAACTPAAPILQPGISPASPASPAAPQPAPALPPAAVSPATLPITLQLPAGAFTKFRRGLHTMAAVPESDLNAADLQRLTFSFEGSHLPTGAVTFATPSYDATGNLIIPLQVTSIPGAGVLRITTANDEVVILARIGATTGSLVAGAASTAAVLLEQVLPAQHTLSETDIESLLAIITRKVAAILTSSRPGNVENDPETRALLQRVAAHATKGSPLHADALRQIEFPPAGSGTSVAPPTITGVAPERGPLAGGTVLTITGTGFSGATTVTVGGTAAAGFTVDSPTQITAVTAAHAAGVVDVVVTTAGGPATKTGAFSYLAAPTLTAVTPSQGTMAGGTSVTLTGTDLTWATGVTFGGVAGTDLVVHSDTSLTVKAPVGTSGAKDVVVTTPGGSATAVAAYTHVPTLTAVSPAAATTAGRTPVTLTGTHFTGATGVTFGGVAGTDLIVHSDTSLTVKTPARATGAVDVVVTIPGSSATLTNGFTYKVNGGVVTTLAGSSMGSADGTGAAASFSAPIGVAVDAAGNVYVADRGNHRIRKVTPGGVVTTLAGNSQGSADGTGAAASFSDPTAVAVDAAGNIYVADALNERIRKVTPAGVVSTLAGSTLGNDDGTGAAARFRSPTGVAVDAAGNVYVADRGNHRIRKVTPGGVVTTLAGSSQGYADGTGAAAQFNRPSGVAVDAAGNVYVADSDNHRIRKVTPEGVVTTLAGSSQGSADGTGAAASFNGPTGVAVDAAGNVYVADLYNDRIRQVTPAGVVTTLAGSDMGYADGTGKAAEFYSPHGVAVDAIGNVYVADWDNLRIRKIE